MPTIKIIDKENWNTTNPFRNHPDAGVSLRLFFKTAIGLKDESSKAG